MLVVPVLPFLSNLGQLIGFGIFVGGIYYSMKQFRVECGESADYGKIVFAGIQTAFFSSLILAFAMYAIIKVIDPSIIGAYLEMAEKMLLSTETPQGIVEDSMQKMREMISPGFIAFAAIFSYCFLGVVVSCVCGLFLRNSVLPGKQQSQSHDF